MDDAALDAALAAIRGHERMLTDEGVILLKFWIHLSKAAQKARLQKLHRDKRTSWRVTRDDWARHRLYSRSHALTPTAPAVIEDWRNRKRWHGYEVAVCDMDRTSTELAPWTLVEAEDKPFARVKVLKTVVRRLEAALV